MVLNKSSQNVNASIMNTLNWPYKIAHVIFPTRYILTNKWVLGIYLVIIARLLSLSPWLWYSQNNSRHDDVIKWKHFPRYWPFARGFHRSPMNSPHKGQSRGALMFSLICARINGWVNNREAGDLRRHRAHYEVIVMVGLRTTFPD